LGLQSLSERSYDQVRVRARVESAELAEQNGEPEGPVPDVPDLPLIAAAALGRSGTCPTVARAAFTSIRKYPGD
jgi:hypothetical protein